MTLDSHVLPWSQTCKQTRRLASAWRVPLKQYKQCMVIAFLSTGSILTRYARPVSVRKSNLQLFLAGTTSWSRMAPRRLSCGSGPWRCTQQQPPVAYFPPEKPLQQQGPPSTTLRPLISLVLPDRRENFEDFSSIRLVRQQFLEEQPACCPLLSEGH